VLDGGRHPIAGELEELGVRVVEHPRRERPDVGHPDQLALRDQRYAQQGADALVDQDRVHDVVGADVRQRHRSPLGGHSTREPPPHRDAHTCLDLLLEPLRGARDQLVGRWVVQEDGGGVDVEDAAQPGQQRLEQVVEVQVRERRVGERLELGEALECGVVRRGPPRARVGRAH
jgi:hypothetical protein